jgi:hypothetical protein
MRKNLLLYPTIVFLFLTMTSGASATKIYLSPQNQDIDAGQTLSYDLFADIDETDAIMGFGFDLSLDGGHSFVPGPGYTGAFLRFDRFVPDSENGFYYEPAFDSDGDSISGFLPLTITTLDLFGTAEKLGTFEFTLIASGPFSIFIGADDIGMYTSVEGLVPGLSATSYVSFLPNNPTATATPIPEPATTALLAAGLSGLAACSRRRKANVGSCHRVQN